MPSNQLTLRTKEILLKFFDYLERSSVLSRGGVKRFIRDEKISILEVREAARNGKSIILSK